MSASGRVSPKLPDPRHLGRRYRPCLVPARLARHGVLAFRDGRVIVLSQVAIMDAPDGSGDPLPTWLVSVSEDGRVAGDGVVRRVRRDFDMRDAEEDNHEDGHARKLFLVVDPSRRVACECKETDEVVTKPNGYSYSRPKQLSKESK